MRIAGLSAGPASASASANYWLFEDDPYLGMITLGSTDSVVFSSLFIYWDRDEIEISSESSLFFNWM